MTQITEAEPVAVFAELGGLLREQCAMLARLGSDLSGALGALSVRLDKDWLETIRAVHTGTEAVRGVEQRLDAMETRLTARMGDVRGLVQALKADLHGADEETGVAVAQSASPGGQVMSQVVCAPAAILNVLARRAGEQVLAAYATALDAAYLRACEMGSIGPVRAMVECWWFVAEGWCDPARVRAMLAQAARARPGDQHREKG